MSDMDSAKIANAWVELNINDLSKRHNLGFTVFQLTADVKRTTWDFKFTVPQKEVERRCVDLHNELTNRTDGHSIMQLNKQDVQDLCLLEFLNWMMVSGLTEEFDAAGISHYMSFIQVMGGWTDPTSTQ